MLKQNDALITQYPMRFFGGAAVGQTSASRNNFNHPSVSLNRFFSGDGFDTTSSTPVGYSGIYAEVQSMKASGSASSTGISGLSTISANAVMIGTIASTSNINGSGSVANSTYLYGFKAGSISASINVGASLSGATVAGAVLGASIEGSYALKDVLKIVAAVSAGKVSGGPGSPVFRGITDSSDVVSGTVDSNGNRTSVTLNPS